ncbi:MAG: PilZ domain-containing protein [Thermodesulfobacteriota bacterium]
MRNATIRSNELVITETPGTRGVERASGLVKAAGVINSLNRINFHGDHVFVRLRHVWNNSFVTVAAKPEPGDGAGIQLLWNEAKRALVKDIHLYEYCGLFYTDGPKMVWVKAGLISMNTCGVTLAAPEGGDEVNERNYRRYPCLEVSARLGQGAISLQGVMKDYSAAAFAVVVPGDQIAAIRKININMPVNIVLGNGKEVLLDATCRIIRGSTSGPEMTIVLKPVSTNISRFKPKEFRSIRQKLTPHPCIEFNHPFLGKKISLKTLDISGAGISVEEDPANSLLMPGMVIPEIAINFANSFRICCRAQVLYNRFTREGDSVQVGLVFVDMNCENQLQLASILFQAKNERSYVGTAVDQDELWNFFFETGFIYPKKYKSIEEQKANFKTLYSRLYNGCPDIARHVIYRDKGIIYGHLSMLKYYQRTWLLHHHAAIKSSRHKAGLVVMDHLIQHINEVHHLADAAMKYMACYFRPNNRFANRMFGGGLRSLQDPQKGSLDEFAYFHHDDSKEQELPSGWTITRTSSEDFRILKSFYDEISGGLMLVGLDMEGGSSDDEEINARYREKGLSRERKFFSLKDKDGHLVAIFTLNFSDVGLNMSSLTDCIQVMVIDHEKAGSDKILSTLDILGDNYEGKAPVLMFPKSYADDNGLAYENVYTLGVMDSNYICEWLGFLAGLTKPSLRLAKK